MENDYRNQPSNLPRSHEPIIVVEGVPPAGAELDLRLAREKRRRERDAFETSTRAEIAQLEKTLEELKELEEEE